MTPNMAIQEATCNRWWKTKTMFHLRLLYTVAVHRLWFSMRARRSITNRNLLQLRFGSLQAGTICAETNMLPYPIVTKNTIKSLLLNPVLSRTTAATVTGSNRIANLDPFLEAIWM
jgi:hypothetical protein